ncbi:hypothetical protein Ms3S1_34840 [Methylosinus sp. 3S-1]
MGVTITNEENAVAKAELGAKRRCLSCGVAFFDLNRDPIACPKCAAIFQVVELPRSAPRGKGPYRPMQSDARVPAEDASSDETASAETDDAETEADADDAETDDSVPPPLEEDDEIEEIDDLI